MIDQGSQVTLLTENAAQLLRLKPHSAHHIDNGPPPQLTGVGNVSAGLIHSVVNFQLRSPVRRNFVLNVNAGVMKSVTGLLPPNRLPANNVSYWTHLSSLRLADPNFAVPGPIDIILGGDIYDEIIEDGLVRGPKGSPIAQPTVFGWILSGKTSTSSQHRNTNILSHFVGLHTCIDIDARLKSFWEIDNTPNIQAVHTDEERKCEQHFHNTHSRAPDGRYVVRLPLRDDGELG